MIVFLNFLSTASAAFLNESGLSCLRLPISLTFRSNITPGLSWRQCLDDVGSPVTKTWAVGDWCYHLVAQPRKQREAEARCKKLGENGTLYRPVTGLVNFTSDMLSAAQHLLRHNTRSSEDFWIGGLDEQDNEGGSNLLASLGLCIF